MEIWSETKNINLNAEKRSSTCILDFRERMFGANPYENYMEGILEQRNEMKH